ncbi:hypothetical protein FF011L_14140 [Roseimaritima multifibrata]|uniref:Oligogalacturonide lyase n=1 Tax=Roseimaritima multifibrata TaxID=1930274 RepID=A0A517MD11_9BACT|nr:hypothetical protein [Roseimaritima multifibrata]QDS92667.1 hypothetical protein FF011L_14140 [Roseimaritima multifibrata]
MRSLPTTNTNLSRRAFQKLSLAGLASLGWAADSQAADSVANTTPETFVPVETITSGPKHHWFGYYDKREFDPTSRKVLTNQVDFEHRSPKAEDQIQVGWVDRDDNNRFVQIGTSNAWGWQQGCMLQWVGGEGKRVLWNDRQGDQFVCRIMTVADKSVRTIPRPIYTISADGRYGLSADFRRINNLRPGYGYAGLADPYVDQRAPAEEGIWRTDLQTGESQLIISLADVTKIAWPDGELHTDAWHYFNHLLINPSGNRFVFLHRYRPKFDPQTLQFKGGFVTRMFSADMDGKNLHNVDPSGYTSHFIWKNDEQLDMWTRPAGRPSGFYRFTDRQPGETLIDATAMPTNGHNTYLPAPYSDWILNDTYPSKQTTKQTVYLYHIPSKRRFDLGRFPSSLKYRGEWRCDTHPRSSDDGLTVAIDSPHAGGRQVHLLDVSEIVRANS